MTFALAEEAYLCGQCDKSSIFGVEAERTVYSKRLQLSNLCPDHAATRYNFMSDKIPV